MTKEELNAIKICLTVSKWITEIEEKKNKKTTIENYHHKTTQKK